MSSKNEKRSFNCNLLRQTRNFFLYTYTNHKKPIIQKSNLVKKLLTKKRHSRENSLISVNVDTIILI